jgi:AraC family transcriptional regulator
MHRDPPCHELIAQANGEGPLALLKGGDAPMFAARWRHRDRLIPVHQASQHILCYHETGTTQVHKFERGRLAGNRSTPGSLTFIPCDGTEWEIVGECQILHVYLDPALIGDHARQLSSDRLEVNPFFSITDPWLQGFCRMVAAECDLYDGTCDSLLLSQSRLALVNHLLHWHASSRPRSAARPPVAHAMPPARLRAVLDYMQANLARSLTLKELADVACFSEYHFVRCFKQATGATPYRYLLDLRLAAAAERLAKDTAPIKSIAQAVGFANSRHFAAAFKAWCGKAPLEYRQDRRA